MAIKGIYAEYDVKRLNHGIGFPTAAIELLLPTYGEQLGLKGKIATHWALNPHPTLIPAIESGWVEQIHSFGSEVGMDDYMSARSDVYFTGHDGSLRSNRMMCQVAGLYACDMFIGSTLQIDIAGNSSTVTPGRIAGFGGAPNMGSDAHGRRHSTAAWLKAGREASEGQGSLTRGRKLVVQMLETFGEKMKPNFVETLDSVELAKKLNFDLAPVMIYGDDVSHIVTEEGIANLLLCRGPAEREQAVRGVAGFTEVGPRAGSQRGRGAEAPRDHPPSGRSRHQSISRESSATGRPLNQGSRDLGLAGFIKRRPSSGIGRRRDMEQFQVHGTAKSRAGGHRHQAITGVNASGNLEVLVERVLPDHECQVEVATAVTGFPHDLGGGDRGIFRARLAWWLAIFDQRRRGASRHGYVTAHAERATDGGSGMSNLLQTLRADWYEASARERVAGLLDAETFVEFIGPEQRATSPHLAQFDLTGAFDDGIVVGRGRLDGQQVLVAAQEGRFLGGAFGEVHGAKLVGLLRAARDSAGRGRPARRAAVARYWRRPPSGGERGRARDLRDHSRHR